MRLPYRPPLRPARRLVRMTVCVLGLAMLTGCASAGHSEGRPAADPSAPNPASGADGRPLDTPALDLRATVGLDALMPRLAGHRVVYVGEVHDRYEHHLTQLELIKRLHRIHPELAIGMEGFQQPFQQHLDDYIAGRIDVNGLLRATEYYQRWRFDFRHYAAILDYAREHGLPVIALNVAAEITQRAGDVGIAGLPEEFKAQIPNTVDRSDVRYAERLRSVFEQHPHKSEQNFERFLDVQLLWDEGMAARAAEFLRTHPDHRLVVIAGNGHLAFGSGIPSRLQRRVPVSSVILLNGWTGSLEPDVADYLLLPPPRELPAPGRLGMMLEEDERGMRILACVADSACDAAGVQKGERLLSINGAAIAKTADVRVAMWDKRPGDKVTVEIGHKRLLSGMQRRALELQLR